MFINRQWWSLFLQHLGSGGKEREEEEEDEEEQEEEEAGRGKTKEKEKEWSCAQSVHGEKPSGEQS